MVVERNRAAERAPAFGLASLIVPPLAVVAVVCGVIGWLATLRRPRVPGRGSARMGIALAIFLSPVGLYGWGSAWAHTGRDLTKFGSGTEIKAVPVTAPGGGWRLVSSQLSSIGGASPGSSDQSATVTSIPDGSLSDGLPVKVIETTAQQLVTAWASDSEPAGQSTILILFASPGLAGQVYQQQLQEAGGFGTPFAVPGAPGATGLSMSVDGSQAISEMARIGPLVLDVTGADHAGGSQLRSAVTARLLTQMAAVPPSIAHLDAEEGSYGNRHNEVVGALEVLLGLNTVLLLGLLIMILTDSLFDARHRRESAKPVPRDWYPDPTGRNWARWWTGTGWSASVLRDGRPQNDPVAGF